MAPILSKNQKIGIAVALAVGSMHIKKKKKRTKWVKDYFLLRQKLASMNIMRVLEPDDFRNYVRMDSKQFDMLLNLVTPFIQKKDTFFRESISAKQRLVVTLRFLATGNSYSDLKFTDLISQPSLTKIIPETCLAIYRCLEHYIKLPQSEPEWEEIAKDFDEKWNFSHCIGAVDGKHITIEKPPGSGSLFYNYKGFYSIILFAIVNANYEFLYVQTGTNGAVNDSGVFETTKFYQKFMNGDLNLPEPSPLPGTQISVPYVLVGDSAFPINKHFMKPFPFKDINKEQRIFNYRLSRARRIVENAFGILASRFRVLRRPINLDLENVDAVVLACCALHNYLRKRSPRYITTKWIDLENTSKGSFTRGHWRNYTDGLSSLKNTGKRQRNEEGKQVRDTFMKYFNSKEGRVSFQDKMVNITPT